MRLLMHQPPSQLMKAVSSEIFFLSPFISLLTYFCNREHIYVLENSSVSVESCELRLHKMSRVLFLRQNHKHILLPTGLFVAIVVP
jgi:hypothetical protein